MVAPVTADSGATFADHSADSNTAPGNARVVDTVVDASVAADTRSTDPDITPDSDTFPRYARSVHPVVDSPAAADSGATPIRFSADSVLSVGLRQLIEVMVCPSVSPSRLLPLESAIHCIDDGLVEYDNTLCIQVIDFFSRDGVESINYGSHQDEGVVAQGLPVAGRETVNGAQTIYDVLDAWELASESADLGAKYMKDWREISTAVGQLYPHLPAQRLGSYHLGVNRTVRVSEGLLPVSDIGIQLLVCDSLVLSDPVYSYLVRDAYDSWCHLPEHGQNPITDQPFISVNWNNLWSIPAPERKGYLRQKLPTALQRLRELRELFDIGAIRYYPWELVLREHTEDIQQSCRTLLGSQLVKTSTAFPQQEYNLGVRLGPIGVQLKHGDPARGLPPGTQLWCVEKSPILYLGILNTVLSRDLGAIFVPNMNGDRVVFDFIRSGGELSPEKAEVVKSFDLPDFSKAIWPDIIAIRKDSEILTVFRNLVAEASVVENHSSLNSIRERLEESSARIKEDTALLKVVGGATVKFSLAAVGGFIGGVCLGVEPSFASIATAAVGGVGGFLWDLYNEAKGASGSRKKSDLILSVADRL